MVVSAFYALQDTQTPVKVACIALASNLAFSMILMTPLKHGGLALALSLASVLQLCLLVFLLKRKVKTLNLRSVLHSAAKSTLSAVVMGAGIYFIYGRWLTVAPQLGIIQKCAELACLVFIGAALYFGTARLMRCPELASLAEVCLPITKRLFPKRPH